MLVGIGVRPVVLYGVVFCASRTCLVGVVGGAFECVFDFSCNIGRSYVLNWCRTRLFGD